MKDNNKIFTEIFSEITERLNELDQYREKILNASRQMVRNCSVAIKAIHRKDDDLYQDKIKEIKEQHSRLLTLTKKSPQMLAKYLKTPEQEYIEALGLKAIIQDQPILSPKEYGVDDVNYLLGLADIIGELRRHALDQIRQDEIEGLESTLENMENLHSLLFALDYPKSITQDLRRKTDVGRSIIEKTRGDITLAIQIYKLNQDLKSKQ